MKTPQRHHPESRLRRFLRAYRYEIIWLAVISLGVFLVLERLSIRESLSAWLRQFAAAAQHGVSGLGGEAAAFLGRITLSDAVGFLMVLSALVAIALRLRWRMLHNPALAVLRCPKCNDTLHRVHRHAIDRIISLYVPVRRYRCANDECRWHGLRVGAGHDSGRAPALKGS